jgi:hypothetical protein
MWTANTEEAASQRPATWFQVISLRTADGIHASVLMPALRMIPMVVDGMPSGCSIAHCNLRKLTVSEAVYWKYHGPNDRIVEDRWWGTLSAAQRH